MKIAERLVSLFGTTNTRLVRAYKQAKECYRELVGATENTVLDCGEYSEDGKAAIKFLTDGENLRTFLYKEAFFNDTIYEDGCISFGTNAKKKLQDLRFIGEEKMKIIIDWIIAYKNDNASYPCDWTIEKFNQTYPEHKQL